MTRADVRAEVLKLLTLPALRWTIALTWAATALLAFAAHRTTPHADPITTALRWTQAGYLVFGVLTATQEYEPGGQIRATLLAMPHRWRLTFAKTAATALVTLPLAAPAGPSTAAYLIGVVLVGAAAGSLSRSPIAGVASAVTLYLLVCPIVRAGAPSVSPWLPDTTLTDPSHGAAAAAIWPTAATLTAGAFFHRRNA
ncbi:hypothetical protein [Actinoplanes sp. URMC 104]|uniref:hypothetical protein n=1 Tax=Actinoplanes sp. URMC 104 TaxID=3423409 RepID=UPI003F1A58A9